MNTKKVNTILFLAANPKDTPSLELTKEVEMIDEKLRLARFRDMFDLKQHWEVNVANLQSHLLRHNPNIMHFSGHGSAIGEIILEDKFGNSQPVSVRALSNLFSALKDNVRCVVLNACYTEKQAEAIAEHIDCVVGMSRPITDVAAISFAVAFYQAIGYGKDVKTAFTLGRGQLDLENIPEIDTPKLKCHNANPEQLVFVVTRENKRTISSQSELRSTRDKILELALVYGNIRNDLPPSDKRTREMEKVFTDMRILSFKSHPLLKNLVSSTIAGERLAAIAILQSNPGLLNRNFLDWIVRQVTEEKPFVGYHAAKTLLAAVHYPSFKLPRRVLLSSIKTAMKGLGPKKKDTDRYRALEKAEKDL